VLREGFEYKDIVFWLKRSQGIAIANYLTEQNIPLLSETLMIQNATEVSDWLFTIKIPKKTMPT
jgi:hypothetical protein